MKTFLVSLFVFSVLISLADAAPMRGFKTGLLQLGAGYTAKMMCSCLFVTGQTEKFCREYAKLSPDVFLTNIDRTTKQVEATSFVLWRAHATYVNARVGCRRD